MSSSAISSTDRHLQRVRWRLLVNLVRLLEPLMAFLGIVWLLVFVLELTVGVTPGVELASGAIWFVFVVDFAAEFLVAPSRKTYLRRHWLVLISLALPALRVVRTIRIAAVARIFRSIRGIRLVRTLTSINRAMASLRATMHRRGFAYVSVLTLLVTLAGAGAMLAFERDVPDPAGIHDFGTAFWWTAMIMTTMGSAYFPQTPEGRTLCVLLALYAFAVFGYVTATLATFFVSRDVERSDAPAAGEDTIDALRRDVSELSRRIAKLRPESLPRQE
jgi:voltage-gated potassium channel